MLQWGDGATYVLDHVEGHVRQKRGQVIENSMVVLPLPFVLSLLWALAAVLIWRLDLGRAKAAVFFSMLFAVFAVETLLVALRFGYGVEQLVVVQRILPLLVGPLMYLAFSTLAVSSERFRKMAFIHLGAVAVFAFGMQLFPSNLAPLDWLIGLSYLVYAVALLLLWRKGGDHLIHAHMNVSRSVVHWMLWGAGLLVLLLVFDTAIAVSFAAQKAGQALTIISYGSIALIPVLLIIFFILPSFLKARIVQAKLPIGGPIEGNGAAVKLEAEARTLLNTTKLYLDPDLSVQRLAKRLHVPARNLSLAINETQGMNVSQYVNGYRLSHAADLLRESDDSVAKVMAQSGFLTRSNFYREFQRVYGQSPAAFRQQNLGD